MWPICGSCSESEQLLLAPDIVPMVLPKTQFSDAKIVSVYEHLFVKVLRMAETTPNLSKGLCVKGKQRGECCSSTYPNTKPKTHPITYPMSENGNGDSLA